MPQHRGFSLVGVGQDLAVEVEVTRFRNILGDGVEEPQAVVTAVLLPERCSLVPRMMIEGLDQRDRAAGRHLAGQHQLQTLFHAFPQERDDTQQILHGIAKPETVALSVVDQRGGTRPRVGDEGVVRMPDVDHAVEFGIWRLNSNRAEPMVPGSFELLQLLLAACRIAELGRESATVRFRRAQPEHDDELARLAGREIEVHLQDSDQVFASGFEIAQAAALQCGRAGVGAVAAEEVVPQGLERHHRCTRELHPVATGVAQALRVEGIVRV
jgi:hypothetical protein